MYNFLCKVCGFNITVKDKETLQDIKNVHGYKSLIGIVCDLVQMSNNKLARPELAEYLEKEKKGK